MQDIRPIEERSLCPCTNFCLCCLALPGFCVPALLCLCGQVQKLGRDHGIKVACPWLHLEVACFWGQACVDFLHMCGTFSLMVQACVDFLHICGTFSLMVQACVDFLHICGTFSLMVQACVDFLHICGTFP